MQNFPQSFEPVGSDSILEQFIQFKKQTKEKLSSNEYVKTTPQTLTEEEKAQARENIGAGASSINVIDNLNSHSNLDALSANQGRVLNEKIDSSISVLNQIISQNVNELQQDIDANGGDIAGLQGDVSELNQQIQRTLKTPISTPANTIVIGVDDNGDQINLQVGNGLNIENGVISVKKKYINCFLSANASKNWSTFAIVNFNQNTNNSNGYLSYLGNGEIKVLKDCKIKTYACINTEGPRGNTRRFGIYQNNDNLIAIAQTYGNTVSSTIYEALNATSYIVNVVANDVISLKYQNTHNGDSGIRNAGTFWTMEVID